MVQTGTPQCGFTWNDELPCKEASCCKPLTCSIPHNSSNCWRNCCLQSLQTWWLSLPLLGLSQMRSLLDSLSMMGLCSLSEVIRGFSKVDYVGQIIHYFSSYEFQLLVMDCSPCRRMLFLAGCWWDGCVKASSLMIFSRSSCKLQENWILISSRSAHMHLLHDLCTE